MKPSLKTPGDFTVAEGHGHPLILYIKTIVSVCVGSALKIFPITACVGSALKIFPIIAHSPEITHLNTLNMALLTVSVFGHLQFACTGGFTKT